MEPNALEKFDESAKHEELKQSEDIPDEVEDVKNVKQSCANLSTFLVNSQTWSKSGKLTFSSEVIPLTI